MIDEVRIDADEDGFHLILHGDFELIPSRIDDGLNLRLSFEAASQLVAAVEPIREHLAEVEQHRREYDAASPEERQRVMGRLSDDSFLHGHAFVMDGERIDPESVHVHRTSPHNPAEALRAVSPGFEELREAADILRKREKENPPC